MNRDVALETLLATVRRRWLAFVVVVLATLALGAAITATQPERYTAESTVVFLPRGDNLSGFDQTSRVLVPTVSQYFFAPAFRNRVAQAVGNGITGAQVGRAVTTETPAEGAALVIKASTTSPVLSRDISRAATQQFLSLDPGGETVRARATTLADVPANSTQPRWLLNLLASGAAGIIFAVVVVLLVERLARRITSLDQVRALFPVEDVTTFELSRRTRHRVSGLLRADFARQIRSGHPVELVDITAATSAARLDDLVSDGSRPAGLAPPTLVGTMSLREGVQPQVSDDAWVTAVLHRGISRKRDLEALDALSRRQPFSVKTLLLVQDESRRA